MFIRDYEFMSLLNIRHLSESLLMCKTKILTQAASGTRIPLNLLPLQLPGWQFLGVQHHRAQNLVYVSGF